jgi:hypothetical protein
MSEPVRKVVTRSHKGFRSKFPSKKMRRMIGCESLLERDAAQLFEFHPYVLSYFEQPCKEIVYDESGEQHVYTPDFLLEFANSTTCFVEVKPQEKLRCPILCQRIRDIERSFGIRNLSFRLLTEVELHRNPRFETIHLLRSVSKNPPAPEVMKKVETELRLSSSLRYGVLKQMIGETDALRIIAKGRLVINFDEPLTEETLLRDRHSLGGCHDSFCI